MSRLGISGIALPAMPYRSDTIPAVEFNAANSDVCFTLESGHRLNHRRCPLWANSGQGLLTAAYLIPGLQALGFPF